MSVLAQHGQGIQGALGSRGHDGILSQDRKGREFCYHFTSDWWWTLVRSICLLRWKLMRSQPPGVYMDPFTRACHTRLFCEDNPAASRWEFPCDRRDPDVPAACHRHTGTPNTPGKCLSSCSSSTEIMQHPHKEVTPVTGLLLTGQGRTCEETISTSLLSPKYKLQHD